MIDSDIKKVYLADSGGVSFDWMIHKEDIEDFDISCLAHSTFVDVHIVSIILDIEVDEIGFLADETDPDCDPEFPRPVVRRGKQVRWRLKDLIRYIERVAELRWHAHYEMELEELRSRQRESSSEMAGRGDRQIESWRDTSSHQWAGG